VQWPLFRVAVVERSMQPAVRPGDWLLVWRTRRVRAGHLVIARNPENPEMLVIKRATRRLPDATWWLESDNKETAAVDSRRFGSVPRAAILGRVLFRYRHGEPPPDSPGPRFPARYRPR
jgi:nickel-type superoxide dismutase maturation protease